MQTATAFRRGVFFGEFGELLEVVGRVVVVGVGVVQCVDGKGDDFAPVAFGVVVGVVSVVGGVVGVARKEGRMRGVRREISASMASEGKLLVE